MVLKAGEKTRSLNTAIRIYSLAKDLGLDNKELVEIVKKAGISGKGSALASLEDEEVDKVKRGPYFRFSIALDLSTCTKLLRLFAYATTGSSIYFRLFGDRAVACR